MIHAVLYPCPVAAACIEGHGGCGDVVTTRFVRDVTCEDCKVEMSRIVMELDWDEDRFPLPQATRRLGESDQAFAQRLWGKP